MDEDILQFGNTENIYAYFTYFISYVEYNVVLVLIKSFFYRLVEKKNRSRRVTNRAELRDLLAAQGKDLSDLQVWNFS